MNLSQVTPFQRSLLVIDGTVTQFIEAYTFSPVEVVLLHQETQTLPTDHVWLDADKGTEIIDRQVVRANRAEGCSAADHPRLRNFSHCAGQNSADYQRRLDAQRSRFRATLATQRFRKPTRSAVVGAQTIERFAKGTRSFGGETVSQSHLSYRC